MNWLDVAVVAGLAGFALWGFLKGLVKESLGFLGLLLATVASLAVNPFAAGVLRRLLGTSRPFAVLAAAILVFLIVEFVWLLGMFFLLRHPRRQSFRRSGANRVGGALFGMGKGVLLLSLALLVLVAVPMPEAYRAAAEGADLAGRVRAVAPWCAGQVAAILPRAARRRYEAFHGQVAQLGARWRIIAPTPSEPLPYAAPGGRWGVTPAGPQAQPPDPAGPRPATKSEASPAAPAKTQK